MNGTGRSKSKQAAREKKTKVQPGKIKNSVEERQRREPALQASEEKFRRLFETAQDGILLLDAETGVINEANPFMEQLLGYSRDALVGKKLWDIGLFKDILASQDAFLELQQKKYIRYEDLPLETKDGRRRNVEFISNVYILDHQKVIQCNIRDITERKRAEQEIAKLAKFPSENPYPVLRLDESGVILYANKASQGLLAEWGRKNGERSPKRWQGIVSESLASQATRTVETPGNGRIYSFFVVPIVEANYVNLYGHDITERRQAEEELQRTLEELKRSNAELEQFAYVASHDLQEPLRMVSSYMQLLERRYKGQLDKDADEFIAFAVDGAERMQRLINDLLAYSRLGTRGQPFAPTSCEEVLDQALGNLQMAIQANKAEVTHDPLPEVLADETQLVQLFQNLVGNAIKFHGKKKPHVHVSATLTPAPSPTGRGESGVRKGWLFSVCDNGIGIDPQYAERIFIIFQRLNSREKYAGTGIGLAICKKIVQRHGGRIWVESSPGKGATFYFTLPKTGGE